MRSARFALNAEARAARVCAIDVGTSSVRAIAFDRTGQMASPAVRRPHRPARPQPGAAVLDPDGLVDSVAHVLDELCGKLTDPGAVAAVGTSAFWHGLVTVDGRGTALGPAYLWSDTRSESEVPWLRRRLDPDEVHARTGCEIHSSYWPAKLMWLSRSEPETFRNARWFMAPAQYVMLKLFGRLQGSVSMASATGLYNHATDDWDEHLLDVVGIDESRLPPARDDEPLEEPTGPYAGRWAVGDAAWLPPVGDGAASNIGCGCADLDRAALMIGTSGALRVVGAGRPDPVPGLWLYRADGRRFVMGAAFSNGGNVYEWLRQTLRWEPDEHTEAALAECRPDGHGLTFVPHLAGERSPNWRPHARGAIAGLALTTCPIDIVRSALEGIAYPFGGAYRELCGAVGRRLVVIGTGGGLLHSPTWAQIFADVLGEPLTMSAVEEASARGAALLALERVRLVEDAATVEAPTAQTIISHEERHAAYRAAADRQVRLYEVLVGPDR